MGRFLCAAAAALFLIGGSSPMLAQTSDPVFGADRKVLTEAEARRKIENNGYSGVTAMKRDAKGNWTATATKSGKKTTVAVGSTGKVSPGK